MVPGKVREFVGDADGVIEKKTGWGLRQLASLSVIFGTLLTLFGYVHGNWVVPAILQRAADFSRQEDARLKDEFSTNLDARLKRHEDATHVNGVSRAEFRIVLQNIEKLATKDQVEGLTRQMDRIETQMRNR